jgi:hypothetical protein
MKKGIYVTLLFLACYGFSDDAHDEAALQNYSEGEYYDYGSSKGITIYGDQSEMENRIIKILNEGQEDRERFIEEELLIKSGFRRTANVKFRETTGAEKALSVLQGVFHGVSEAVAQIVPLELPVVSMAPFFEEEYARLSNGDFYTFYSVLIHSDLKNVSLETQKIMEAEYKLQIEFSNGVLIENWNLKYYTEENIEKFEQLIVSLSSSREDIMSVRERFLNIELPKIKLALFRYLNSGELYIQARENLRDIIKYNR